MAKRRFIEQQNLTDPLEKAIAKDLSKAKEALAAYRPGNAKQDRIHKSGASTMVIAGGNRSGKSVTGFCEFVSRITGERIYDIDNKPIPPRFPLPQPTRQYIYWLIGYNLDHIGQTFYRMLFDPGLFELIYDMEARRWVVWNETIPWHVENARRKVAAEPLIPQRLIKEDSWSWNPYGGGQAKKCFSSVELTNGAIIYAFPSTTPQPKQGDPIDGLLLDEDVASGGHVPEYMARLTDRSGWCLWPAWPHDDNYMLGSLIDGCKQAMQEGDPRFEYILLTMEENPFFSAEKKQLGADRFRILGDDELVENRVHGIQGRDTRKMYDFQPHTHGICSSTYPLSLPEPDRITPHGALQQTFRQTGGFPDDWTRYFAIDPSTQRAAVVFGVVPPPEVLGVQIPPTLIIEDEVVIKRATPVHVAKACKEKARGRRYEAFIIDRNFGRQRHFSAAGASTMEVLADAFKAEGLFSRLSENWFIPGSNKPEDRYTAVRQLLEGTEYEKAPSMYWVLDRLPDTMKEQKRYLKKQTEFKGVSVIEDGPENPRKFDCMAALEYLAEYVYTMMQCNQHYVPATTWTGTNGMAELASQLRGDDAEKNYIHLGPRALA